MVKDELMQIMQIVGTIAVVFMAVFTLKMVILLSFSYKNHKHELTYVDNDDYNPLVSIISPCYNEAPTLANCIKGLMDQSYKNLEILIVNDGSTDNTVEVANQIIKEYPNVRFFNKENGGKSTALNYGIKHAKGSIIICIDADSVFRKDTVSQLVAPFEDLEVMGVAGNVRISNTNEILTKNQSIEYMMGQNLEKRTFSELNCIQVVSGCVGAFRKDKLIEVGGYSSDTMVEDMDLTVSFAKKGYKIMYNPKAIAYTEAPVNLRDFIKQRYRWCYGRYQVLKKHKDILFKRSYGMMGVIGLPYYLISPLIDIGTSVIVIFTFIVAIITGNLISYAINFGIFAILLIAMISYIMYIDGIKEDRKLPLYLILQSMYYAFILNYINIRAGVDHWIGVKASWNKLARLGVNRIPIQSLSNSAGRRINSHMPY